jgi:hypothetical protein
VRLAATFASSVIVDVLDGNAADGEVVGHQRAMAAPGHSFGAHQHHVLVGTGAEQFVDGGRKLRRLHVVGVSAKAGVAPASVDGVLTGVAQTA